MSSFGSDRDGVAAPHPSGGGADPFDLTGRTLLVTGSSRGIGRAIVERLGPTGARVVAHFQGSPEGAAAAVRGYPADRYRLVRADFADPRGATDLWAEAIAWAGRLDGVVLNAAIMPTVDLDAADGDWDEAIRTALQVNTISQADLARRAVRHFLGAGGGTLIGLSSWVTQRGAGNQNLAVYAASKAATAALLKTVARAYAAQGVLTYLIAPGPVDTAMTATSAADRGGMDDMLRTLTMGELVPPGEIADLVAVLASGRLRHLAGATLDVNGASYIR
jgi:NAD(P)-dependent dehydrogenase (short-subunit alcohol dehydrogenase family)